MKKRQNPRTKSTLILSFCLLFCWAAVGNADDGIQLRKYPSSDGLVLDTISKGKNVKIIEAFGPWRYVVVEGSDYGGGWVHFQDLEKETSKNQKGDVSSKSSQPKEEEPPSPQESDSAIDKPSPGVQAPAKGKTTTKPSFQQSKVSVGAVKIHPIKPHKEAQETKPEKPLNKSAEPKKEPPDHASKSRNNALKEVLQPGRTAIEERPQRSQSVKPTPPIPSQTAPAGPRENFHEPEEHSPMEMIKTAHADPLPKTPVPSSKMQNDPAIPGARSQSSDRPTASTRVDNAQGFPTKEKGASRGPGRDLINFGFRLLSVLLSCIAIVFAYKAKKMADMSYHLVVQLQQKIEIHYRREFDERY